MKSMTFPKTTPFDEVTGDLRPDYRDAYLRGQLGPVVAQQVVAYLEKSSIQKSVLLGRYHELSTQANALGHTLVPPRWVQQQLLRQASYSAAGPLQRPLVRVVLGVVLVLCLASGVQWLRNEPLLPAPVAAAVERAATSASQATRALVQRFTVPKPAAAQTSTLTARTMKKPRETSSPSLARAVAPAASSGDSVARKAPPLADSTQSVALTEPAAPNGSSPAPAAKNTLMTQVVRGRVSDAEGRPLPGATVLVPGTPLITTTNATGDYTLSVPAGTSIKIGYAGLADEVLRTSSTAISSTHNVVLTMDEATERPHRRR